MKQETDSMKNEDGSQHPEVRSQKPDLRPPTSSFILHPSYFLCLLLAATTPLPAATSNAPAGTKKASAQKVTGAKVQESGPDTAPLANLPVPKSSFGLSRTSGKDPFYPNSERLQEKLTVTTTNQVAAVVPEVRINGFSGNAARPLVILNNQTFGEGDEQNVTTAAGRARVRCVGIRMAEQTVEIEINGQRQTLKFQDRK